MRVKHSVCWKMACLAAVNLTAHSHAQDTADSDLTLDEQIRFFRWLEDYSYLADESDLNGLERIKYIPLGLSPKATPYLSFGGQYRFRVVAFDNPIFKLRGTDDFTSLNHRFLLHSDLQVSNRVRVFGQLGYYQEDGREPNERSVDESQLDVHQLFVDIGLSQSNAFSAQARLGRQEILLPSTRFLGVREFPNQRRAFDAVQLSGHADVLGDGARWQAFYAKPVVPQEDAFEDEASDAIDFFGAYLTLPGLVGPTDAEVFYLGYEEDDKLWYQGVADEERHTVGLRLLGEAGPWSGILGGAYQFGTFGEGDISAWGLESEIAYAFADTPWGPRLALNANYASGDKDGADVDLQTFNALFPNLSYFTDAAVYAPTNAVDIHPSIAVQPTDTLTLEAGATAIWRVSDGDGIYGAAYSPLIAPTEGGSYVGTFLDVGATWSPTGRWQLGASYVHGVSGDLTEDAGGRDFNFLSLTLGYTF